MPLFSNIILLYFYNICPVNYVEKFKFDQTLCPTNYVSKLKLISKISASVPNLNVKLLSAVLKLVDIYHVVSYS